ncbi:LacI family DNA-binding transcriptional regulator [Paenibacillus sp. N4]|uniref:LacI family DNA-binding transcriptional regulator n=1 Tax=Paenibacillus vietnamensis TaxID=2590547 RepID=UPI001CD0AD90|nr:LacI family DNA-binding transcriptional regulator [Paenibacillus vietnamensis]MCA0757361.1 LacI family DNA-binding transcriptional regulator [Paenibacillus vietnamensis]
MKMEDIARLAGVSKAAVSLALNGKPGIGAETRDRILQIAEENGYTHKARASVQEQTMKSLTFLAFANSGIVLEQYYQQPFFRELIHHIEERCRLSGFSLIYTSIEQEHFKEKIKALDEEKRSDGVILLGTNLDQAQIAAVADNISVPLVVLDNCFETLPVHFVAINNVMGAYQAGSHLCAAQHRNIGYIASNVRIHNFDERKRGFDAALRDNGLQVNGDAVFSVAPTILSSQEALKSQLTAYLESGRTLPTAFFCECDYIAISAIKTLAELGYRIPEDVSVIGFDNISEARIVSPELSTIHVAKERMAHLAVDLLLEAIASDDPAKTKITVDTRLVERHSTGVPLIALGS